MTHRRRGFRANVTGLLDAGATASSRRCTGEFWR
jgi:hypothetical protein